MDDADVASANNRRSLGGCERWIREERRIMQAMEQRAIGEAMDGASGGSGSYRQSDGSESNRRSDGWCEQWIRKL